MSIHFFTDGACSGNPGPGGYAIVTKNQTDEFTAFYGYADHTTNNRMELLGVICALDIILQKQIKQAIIFTDSTYVRSGMLEWLPNWKKNNWLNSAKKPVKNRDLWELLDTLFSQVAIYTTIEWVKGHSTNIGNNLADAVACCSVNKHNNCECNIPITEYVL